MIKLFDLNFLYSEDCLYFNVYFLNVSLSLFVMVYIYGGGYEVGIVVLFYGDILVLRGVEIVVI